jgi:hypothetical protein
MKDAVQSAKNGGDLHGSASIGWFIVWLVAIVGIWGLSWWLITTFLSTWDVRGTFGDMFGAVNSLFSGAAFAGVIYAIILQRRELELQRKEIVANREELARSAEAQEKSYQALTNAIYAQTYKAVVDILQDEDVREARRIVVSQLGGREKLIQTEQDRKAAERVCHTYDAVGQMVRHGMLPIEYIIDSWGDSLRRTWTILKPLVSEYRSEREAPETWDDYEYLAIEAFRRVDREPPAYDRPGT